MEGVIAIMAEHERKMAMEHMRGTSHGPTASSRLH